MIYYTVDLDIDNIELLIDVLAAAIALAERDEATPETTQAIRLISVGTPLLECLRKTRTARPASHATPLEETPRLLPQGRSRRTLL